MSRQRQMVVLMVLIGILSTGFFWHSSGRERDEHKRGVHVPHVLLAYKNAKTRPVEIETNVQRTLRLALETEAQRHHEANLRRLLPPALEHPLSHRIPDLGVAPLSDLKMVCSDMAPPAMVIPRANDQGCDRSLPSPPEPFFTEPYLTAAPRLPGYVFLFWRIQTGNNDSAPQDLTVALMHLKTGVLVPHGLTTHLAGYHSAPSTLSHMDLDMVHERRLLYMRLLTTHCAKVNSIGVFWFHDRMYIKSSTTCGKQREFFFPISVAASLEAGVDETLAEPAQINRWRMWHNYTTPRYYIHTPMPDVGPVFGESVHMGAFESPSNHEFGWTHIQTGPSSFAYVRHLCPFTVLELSSFSFRGQRHIVRLTDVPTSVPTYNVLTRPLTTTVPPVATEDSFRVSSCGGVDSRDRRFLAEATAPDNLINDFDSKVWRLPSTKQLSQLSRYIYEPFGRSSTTILDRTTFEETCVLAATEKQHIRSNLDPYFHLDQSLCLQHELYRRTWHMHGTPIPVAKPDSAPADDSMQRYLGIAHLSTNASSTGQPFHYHFFFLVGVQPNTEQSDNSNQDDGKSEKISPTVKYIATSRLFRFRARHMNRTELSIGLHPSGEHLLLAYGLNTPGVPAHSTTLGGRVAIVPTSTVEAMLFHTFKFDSSLVNIPDVLSPSVIIVNDFDHPLFSKDLSMRRQAGSSTRPNHSWLY